jgi:uncharacterized membrane protein
MAFDWVELVRLIHILAAAVWFGGGMLGILIIGPSVAAAGEAGKAFMGVVMKRGGFAKIMGPASNLTVLAGLALYWQRGYHHAPFATASVSLVTIGGLIGVLVLAMGYLWGLPLQKKMAAIGKQVGPGGPTTEQAKQMAAMGATLTRMGHVTMGLVALTMVLMVGRNVFY